MKTRRSNRAKKPAVAQNPDIDFGDDDHPLPVSTKRRDDPDDDDFNPPSPANAEQEDDASDAAEELMELDEAKPGDVAIGNEDSDFSGEDKPTPRQRAARKIKAASLTTTNTGYLDITTTGGSHFVQGFVGPFDRGVRGGALIRAWYAPHALKIRQMLGRWYELSVLPPKVSSATGHDDLALRPWSAGKVEQEQASAEAWYQRMKAAQPKTPFRVLSETEAQPYNAMLNTGSMPVLAGPSDAQKDFHLTSGDIVCLDSYGAPSDGDDDDGRANAGWLFDAGGIVPSLSWKYSAKFSKSTDQILAMAVISHSDQAIREYMKESQQNPDFLKHGTVQIWAFPAEESDGLTRASRTPARCLRTLCFDNGRVRKVQWSPLGGLLAVLCGDGSVSIVEPKEGGDGEYDFVENPIARLDLAPEAVKATAMTWNSCNRLSVGYADGSIAVWSIFPKRLLSRHAVHINHITEMASGYPTFPYVVATSPVGGPPKLVDLRSPSLEITESSTSSVSTSAGVISYSDHLLGFHFPLPSASPLNTVVGFSHHAYYPISRRISTPDSFVTSLSAGRTHPYLLIGTADGSLWSLNPQCELFSSRHEISDRLRVFQHEHRSAGLFKSGEPRAERGASRILQGFPKEGNPNPRSEIVKMAAVKKGAVKKKAKAKGTDGDGMKESAKEVIHEPLTRVTAVQWNPNPGYGCWAAVAMASGLVRVMDLGLEMEDSAD